MHRDVLRGRPGPRDLPRAAAHLPLVGAGRLPLADGPGRPAVPARPAPGEAGKVVTAVSSGILDAAQQVFEQYGARRANVEDVAKVAGISRSTLYRAYPTKEALLQAVLDREIDVFFDQLDTLASDLPPRQAVIECFTAGIALTREIPLLARLVETEPEIITGVGGSPHSSTVLGSAHRVAQTLRRSGATMPEHELHVVAELMLRIAYTYMLNPLGSVDMTDDVQVRAYAERYLASLVY
ncbi:MAG: TetR family transcriptional regulator [Microbacterium sp.]|nr:MAG: TetR family transcriptional regulator [Microbacterium sp.]